MKPGPKRKYGVETITTTVRMPKPLVAWAVREAKRRSKRDGALVSRSQVICEAVKSAMSQ